MTSHFQLHAKDRIVLKDSQNIYSKHPLKPQAKNQFQYSVTDLKHNRKRLTATASMCHRKEHDETLICFITNTFRLQ